MKKIPKLVPTTWKPENWNEVIWVISQIVKGNKINFNLFKKRERYFVQASGDKEEERKNGS